MYFCGLIHIHSYTHMKRIILALTIILITSCQLSEKFEVLGHIEGAAGEMIYLEHSGLSKITTLDSTKVNKQGNFKFKHKRPEYPDFYRLKLTNKYIIFTVDSTEMIEIHASKDSFSNQYTMNGSGANQDIQWLRNSVANIQNQANTLANIDNEQERETLVAEIVASIETHKDSARYIILKNPRSTAAYFAIFQKINNIEIFSPFDKEDRPYCAAVATSYHTFMPNYVRSKSLYNYVMEAIKSEREAQQQADWQQIMEETAIGYIDIALPDKDGHERKLSDNTGKVILLDFSAYEMPESTDYTFALRDLYAKYKSKGLVIYQVSLDRYKFLWEDAVENLPWTCVRDENNLNSAYALYYNISALPTSFLIDRKGDIVARDLDFNALEKEIQKHL